MIYFVILITGFIPLIYGATILVDGSSSLAKQLNIPDIIIGLTIVAFGTSMPELFVNLFSSMLKQSDIALNNILGSNIFNILVIAGGSAIITPLAIKSNTIWMEIPLCFLSALAVFIVSNDAWISGKNFSVIDRSDGLILVLFFCIFLAYTFKMITAGNDSGEKIGIKNISILKSIFMIVAGLFLLIAGGKLIVTYAVKFAELIGISERIVALTIISIGTSLPELATSFVAAKKKNIDIAIGNIVGSNIFNSFFILGISAIISPVKSRNISNIDFLINILSSFLLFIFVFTFKGRKIDRVEGGIFIVLYFSYLLLLVGLHNF